MANQWPRQQLTVSGQHRHRHLILVASKMSSLAINVHGVNSSAVSAYQSRQRQLISGFSQRPNNRHQRISQHHQRNINVNLYVSKLASIMA